MLKVNVLVISGYGLNCEEETAYGFKLAGAKAEVVHINDLIDGRKKLKDYQILVFPGGFSYGDDTGSGYAFASRVKSRLWEQTLKFISQDKLVLGICNGFQILVNLGLLPGALMWNDIPQYVDKWVELKVVNQGIWLQGLNQFKLPVAHGEGKFYSRDKVSPVLQYINNTNPNGSLQDIAGITDESGRVFGLMPHPERGMLFLQQPDWPLIKEKLIRSHRPLPEFAPGLKIFQNGVKYFK